MGIGEEKGQQYHTSGHICGIVSNLVWLEYENKEKEVWPQMKESIHFQAKEYGLFCNWVKDIASWWEGD